MATKDNLLSELNWVTEKISSQVWTLNLGTLGPRGRFSLPAAFDVRWVDLDMPLYWLCYQHNNQISVVIEPGASPIHARKRAALANLDQGEFTEGHELDRKWQVPKEMVGRRLSQEEAKRLLAKLE
jgi:hypothetical protein